MKQAINSQIKRIEYVSYCALCLVMTSLSMITFLLYIMFLSHSDYPCPDLTKVLENITIDNPRSSMVLDSSYYAITPLDMDRILHWDSTNSYVYKIEGFDCDEYGIILMANLMKLSYKCEYEYRIAIGIITGDDLTKNMSHLMNFFIDPENKVWCIEPQDDMIIQCENTNYVFTNAIM